MTCPDPRPLSPPDDPPSPAPQPFWHFLSSDWNHEEWTDDPEVVDSLMQIYASRGPFTVEMRLYD